jgi:hypothetical protein
MAHHSVYAAPVPNPTKFMKMSNDVAAKWCDGSDATLSQCPLTARYSPVCCHESGHAGRQQRAKCRSVFESSIAKLATQGCLQMGLAAARLAAARLVEARLVEARLVEVREPSISRHL